MFNSGFSEAIPRDSSASQKNDKILWPLQTRRRVINVTDDYDIFRVVLFYIYTDTIVFTSSISSSTVPGNVSSPADADHLYVIAHRLLLDSLCNKVQHYLYSTCTPENISARLLGGFAATYPEMGKAYDRYFLRNWEQVMMAPGLELYFRALEEDPAEYIRASIKLRSLIRKKLQPNITKYAVV